MLLKIVRNNKVKSITMKQILLAILLITCALTTSLAQSQKVIFRYDGAGNRVLRKLDVGKMTEADTMFKTDSIGNKHADIPINGLKVYPNPANNYINIEFESVAVIAGNYSLFDVNGRLLENGVLNSSITKLNLEDKSNGIYVIIITSGLKQERFKIIKQ